MTPPAPDLTDVRAASELLAFGLARTARPVDGSDYRTLLDRYRTSIPFKDTVDTIAEGLGLEVLGTPRTGLVLAPARGCRRRCAPRCSTCSSPGTGSLRKLSASSCSTASRRCSPSRADRPGRSAVSSRPASLNLRLSRVNPPEKRP